MEKLPSNVVHLPMTLRHLENIDLPPKITKHQLNINPKKTTKIHRKLPIVLLLGHYRGAPYSVPLGAQRQCSEQSVRNRQCSEQCSEPTQKIPVS